MSVGWIARERGGRLYCCVIVLCTGYSQHHYALATLHTYVLTVHAI